MNLKYHSFNCLIAILFITILSSYSTFAQSTDTIQWSEKYGVNKVDAFHSIIENRLGQVVAVGTVTSSKKNKNILFAKINAANGLLLDPPKELGGPTDDFAYRIIQTIEDTYVIVGSSEHKNGKVQNAFLMQVDAKGIEVWKKIFKLGTSAAFYDVVQNKKGELYVTGRVGKKACLVKYTEEGVLVWEKIFDPLGEATGLSIKLTAEEDIIIAIHQEKRKHHSTFLQRIDANSITVWEQEFSDIKVKDLWIEADTIAATGTLYSSDKQKIEDLFLLTLTLEGNEIKRSDQIRNRGKDGGHALIKSKDGFYYTAGYNSSFDTNINLPKLWVSKIDEAGKKVYPDYYIAGGASSDKANDIIELRDGSLIIAGQSESAFTSLSLVGQSFSPSTSLKKGAWLMKLLPAGYVPLPPSETIKPEPTVDTNKPSITITWLNNLKKEPGDIYKAYQPVIMRLRAIIDSRLKGIEFTVALNDSEDIVLTSTKEKTEIVGVSKGRSKKGTYDINFDDLEPSLKEGRNKIYIKGDDVLLEEFSIDYTLSMPNLHLVSIGIPYEDELDYTSKDARDFANLFAESKNISSLFKEIQIDTLTSKVATEGGVIKRKMLGLKGKEVKSNDYILIFISAHGLIYKDQLFIPASNYGGEDIDAINFRIDIIERLKELPCKKLIFIDACNSGKGVKNTINSTAEALLKITEAANDFYIMTSSSAKQKSYENVAWKNGAFTKALTEAFKNEKVDIGEGIPIQANTNDSYLTLAELFTFTQQRVAFLAQSKKKEQTPFINKDLSELDFPIFWFGDN